MDSALKRLIVQLLDDTDLESDGLLSGQITPDGWQQIMARNFLTYHTVAYLKASGAKTLTPDGRRVVLAEVARQVDYLNAFADAVDAGTAGSEAQIRARARLYAGALKATYSRGQFAGWPLPFHPGDGSSECGGACGCRWNLRIIDAKNGDADAVWEMGKAMERHCTTCPTRANQSPYRIRGGKLL